MYRACSCATYASGLLRDTMLCCALTDEAAAGSLRWSHRSMHEFFIGAASRVRTARVTTSRARNGRVTLSSQGCRRVARSGRIAPSCTTHMPASFNHRLSDDRELRCTPDLWKLPSPLYAS